ncbi:MAG: alpha-xylosidase [Eubacterium sp.]|nr:alpha-xylosidase [Eubacterium sp.]
MLKESLVFACEPKADEEQIKVTGDVRITYLTSRLLRVESAPFCDKASYAVWYRKFPSGRLDITKKGSVITAETEDIILTVKNKKPYSVFFKDAEKTEVFSKQKNLGGTYRTLDNTSGRIPLENGFITEGGAYLFDDGKSILLDENGEFTPRDGGNDYYAFAYGKDYRGAMNAFYAISGKTPIVPRFALGVWWSRYHAYTQEEYLSLMDRFEKEEIPLTVATVDMDWHWVDIKKQFRTNERGWTGYSWNTNLFPDYKAFLKELKEKNLHITLNLHPADGVRYFDDMYEEMARANGIDPKTKEPVKFRCGDSNFWNSYFDILHKPYEKDGVDFWWIDWQQGKSSDVPGLDPLPALNHYHYLDNAENGDIPLILSRYGGVGSHRYPLGFSGDTAIKWEVLDFQPCFTNTAANAAYCWWSHDIGGHHKGYRDDDLYLRWIEYATFSPILRLHSTAIEFLGKEPWKYRQDVYLSSKEWLNFRHRLIPYIYTADRRCHGENIPLCEPMYYSYPEEEEAYNVPNQFKFGSELIVCPITSPQNKELGKGSVEAWLPEGEYTDIFTLEKYSGAQRITLNRELYTIPVLAKAGAVIPMSGDKGNSSANPELLEVWVFKGNNTYTMLEDNGKTDFEEHTAKTVFENIYDEETDTVTLKIHTEGDLGVIPSRRKYKIVFRDIDTPDVEVKMLKKGNTVSVENPKAPEKESYRERIINIMSRWNETTAKKSIAYKPFEGLEDKNSLWRALYNAKLPTAVSDRIKEILSQ